MNKNIFKLIIIGIITFVLISCDSNDDFEPLPESYNYKIREPIEIIDLRVYRDKIVIEFNKEPDEATLIKDNFLFKTEIEDLTIEKYEDNRNKIKLYKEEQFIYFNESNKLTIKDIAPYIFKGEPLENPYEHEYTGPDSLKLRISNSTSYEDEYFRYYETIDELKFFVSKDVSDEDLEYYITPELDKLKLTYRKKIKTFFDSYGGKYVDFDDDGSIIIAITGNNLDYAYYETTGGLTSEQLDYFMISKKDVNPLDLIVIPFDFIKKSKYDKPGTTYQSQFDSILSHELQHSVTHKMISEQYSKNKKDETYLYAFLVYELVTEGLSTLTQYLLFKETDYWAKAFSLIYDTDISLIYWNQSFESYSSAMLFMLYLYSQYSDRNNFYKDFLNSGVWDLNSLNSFCVKNYGRDFSQMYKDWLMALTVYEKAGNHSYNGELKIYEYDYSEGPAKITIKDHLELPYVNYWTSNLKVSPYNITFMYCDCENISYDEKKGEHISYQSVYSYKAKDFTEPFNTKGPGVLMPMFIDSRYLDNDYYSYRNEVKENTGPYVSCEITEEKIKAMDESIQDKEEYRKMINKMVMFEGGASSNTKSRMRDIFLNNPNGLSK